MNKLVGWTVESQYVDQGIRVWRIVSILPTLEEATRAERKLAACKEILATRVMAYYRDSAQPAAAERHPVTRPTRRQPVPMPLVTLHA